MFNMEKMIPIPEGEHRKIQAIKSVVDLDLLEQITSSFKDIKEDRVRRVK